MHYATHKQTAAELIYDRANAGSISAEIAKNHAESEFEKYRIVQDNIFMSDYDRYVERLLEMEKKK